MGTTHAGEGKAPYHHGDLRSALLDATWALARERGAAVTMREVTSAVGVSVNAAYRHFANREALMLAVAARILGEAATFVERRLRERPSSTAFERTRELGRAYIDFARAEPGLFAVAFSQPEDLLLTEDPAAFGESGRTLFQLLSDALDAMVEEGTLPAEQREWAEIPCWSLVHGFAVLAVQGPLRSAPDDFVEAQATRALDSVVNGIGVGGRP